MEDAHRLGGLSGIVDEELEGFIDGVRDEFGEVSGFWVVDAEEAIVAFNGAFFPGAVGGGSSRWEHGGGVRGCLRGGTRSRCR